MNSRNFRMVFITVIGSGLSSWHLPDGICRHTDNGDFQESFDFSDCILNVTVQKLILPNCSW